MFKRLILCGCHRFCRSALVCKQLGELGKVSEDGERLSKEDTCARWRHTHQQCHVKTYPILQMCCDVAR